MTLNEITIISKRIKYNKSNSSECFCCEGNHIYNIDYGIDANEEIRKFVSDKIPKSEGGRVKVTIQLLEY